MFNPEMALIGHGSYHLITETLNLTPSLKEHAGFPGIHPVLVTRLQSGDCRVCFFGICLDPSLYDSFRLLSVYFLC